MNGHAPKGTLPGQGIVSRVTSSCTFFLQDMCTFLMNVLSIHESFFPPVLPISHAHFIHIRKIVV